MSLVKGQATLADVGAIKSTYGGYAGWNDPASIVADFNATGGSGKGGPTSSSSSSSMTPGATSSSSTPSSIDPQQATANAIASAQAVQNFNIQAAQPQISTLQSGQSNLDTQYQNMLASIKGDQTLAVNNTTAATNAIMAQRGISNQSGDAQTNLAQAQSAAAQPYSSLYNQTQQGQANQDFSIANQIAALQAGNPTQALDTSSQINGLAGQLGQLGINQQAQNLSSQYIPIAMNGGIYQPSTNNIISALNGITSPSTTYNP